jgi:L-2-hydroxyglutarate oxidase LhgO
LSDIDAIVIGSGAIGLAAARALALTGRSVVVLEGAGGIGHETSSRNSEVIHSGIYYTTGSLKARLCVQGRRELYAFCDAHGAPYSRCGKLIVATDAEELASIAALKAKGEANGVDDLVWLSAAQAKALEPELACVGALHAPSTGILDSHAFLLALQGDAADGGAMFAFHTPFLRADVGNEGFIVEAGGSDPIRLSAAALINTAGLGASEVADQIGGLDRRHIPRTRYAKGNYFALQRRSPFRRLIYPAPQAHGLGVHLTMDLGGQTRFGPDVEWVDKISYEVDPRRADGFTQAIRRYWPALPDDALTPAYCGIRPKLGGPEDPAADFRIDGPEFHGVRGLVNLFGIESPGLTSALAIAQEIVARLEPAG